MKKLLAIVLVLATLISVFPVFPVFAADATGTTTVTVATGGGTIPVVKCKFEQEPIAVLESGDPTHITALSQFLPPLVKSAKKPIDYYAVVTDAEDMGSVAQVFADVYHPIGSPAPYNAPGGPGNQPYFKYEVPFAKVGHDAAAKALVVAAYNAKLVTFSDNYTIADVTMELDKGTADLWKGTALIDYEQPAGLYTVRVYAIDKNSNLSAVLINQFLYVPVAGVEVDFTGINFGSVNLGTEKMVAGDTIWQTPAAMAPSPNPATVRNIGNTWARVTIKESDMGLGQDVTGMWNVQFDARMGNDNANRVVFDPNVTVTLPNWLTLSSQDELDLSILVKKGFSGQTYSGTVIIGAVIQPFAAQ